MRYLFSDNVPIVFCGTKADLPEEQHVVTIENFPIPDLVSYFIN